MHTHTQIAVFVCSLWTDWKFRFCEMAEGLTLRVCVSIKFSSGWWNVLINAATRHNWRKVKGCQFVKCLYTLQKFNVTVFYNTRLHIVVFLFVFQGKQNMGFFFFFFNMYETTNRIALQDLVRSSTQREIKTRTSICVFVHFPPSSCGTRSKRARRFFRALRSFLARQRYFLFFFHKNKPFCTQW